MKMNAKREKLRKRREQWDRMDSEYQRQTRRPGSLKK